MVGAGDEELALEAAEQRLDKWLWFSRMLKSRTMAAQLVAAGKVRVNRMRALRPSQTVRPGDVLTIAIRGRVQVVRVVATGYRRGPPVEARQLYEQVKPQEVADGPKEARVADRDRRPAD
jgi:ribosome-associated heat shock protein Hsp15